MPTDVVIVDDEPGQIRELSDFVTRCGLTYKTASDGAAALETIRREAPKVVLMDIRMPGLDGMEVASILARTESGPPKLILMSGNSEAVYEANAEHLGVFAVIEKPIPLRILGRFLREAMTSSAQ